MRRSILGLCLGALAGCAAGAALWRRSIPMPLGEYTRYALYMAVLDEEICRGELAGCRMGGRTIVFPPKDQSLQDRYHLFLSMNRGKGRETLRREIESMERRLQAAGQFEKKGEELEVLLQTPEEMRPTSS